MSEAREKALSEEVSEKTKQHVLDTFAAMISGAGLPPGKIALGFAREYGGKAVATAHGLGEKGLPPMDAGLAKRAAHYVGHLWDLHHCFDPRCAMHPGLSPGFAQYPDVALCLFCREKSERKIKLGST